MLLSANFFIDIFAVDLRLHNLIAAHTGCPRTNIAIGNYLATVKCIEKNSEIKLNFAQLDLIFMSILEIQENSREFVEETIELRRNFRLVGTVAIIVKVMIRD